MDAYGPKGFVFEDLSGRRWPRMKRIALVLGALGALLIVGVLVALLMVAPGRTSPWGAAAGLAEQVRDLPQRNAGPGPGPPPTPTPRPTVVAQARPGAGGTARSHEPSRAGATSSEGDRRAAPRRPPAVPAAPAGPAVPPPRSSSTPSPTPPATATPSALPTPAPAPLPVPNPKPEPIPLPTAPLLPSQQWP